MGAVARTRYSVTISSHSAMNESWSSERKVTTEMMVQPASIALRHRSSTQKSRFHAHFLRVFQLDRMESGSALRKRLTSKSPSGHFILRPRALQFDVASAGSSRE